MPEAIHAFLINLERSPERLNKMVDRIQVLNLPWQRIEAIDGRLINVEQHPQVSVPGYERKHGKQLNPAEVGCYLSHIKALDAFLAHPHASYGLILEDDVEFADDFTCVLEALVKVAPTWDMVRLSGFHSGTPVNPLLLSDQRQLCVMLTRQTSAAAYLVNRQAASHMVKHLLPMELPFDHAFDKPWEMPMKARMVYPLPTSLDWSQPSTICPPANAYKRLPWYARFSTHFYRSRTELKRVQFALLQKFRFPAGY